MSPQNSLPSPPDNSHNQSPVQQIHIHQPIAPQPQINQPAFSGLAIAGFVLSLIPSFYITQLIGVTLSALGINECNKSDKRGKGLAIAGLIISTVILVIQILMLIFTGSIFFFSDF